MGFREELQELVGSLDGAVAASVMGMDGIAIDTIEQSKLVTGSNEDLAEIDIQSLLVEYTNVLSQLVQATQLLETGPVEELSVNTARLLTLCRKLNDDYVAVLAIRPEASFGKARYLLRLAASRLKQEF